MGHPLLCHSVSPDPVGGGGCDPRVSSPDDSKDRGRRLRHRFNVTCHWGGGDRGVTTPPPPQNGASHSATWTLGGAEAPPTACGHAPFFEAPPPTLGPPPREGTSPAPILLRLSEAPPPQGQRPAHFAQLLQSGPAFPYKAGRPRPLSPTPPPFRPRAAAPPPEGAAGGKSARAL